MVQCKAWPITAELTSNSWGNAWSHQIIFPMKNYPQFTHNNQNKPKRINICSDDITLPFYGLSD
jgi:hypothetical protein